MADKGSRRSFITDLLARVAGGWAALAGLAGVSSILSSGCSDDTSIAPKYGVKYGPSYNDAKVDLPAPKYGSFIDSRVDQPQYAPAYGVQVIDAKPATKYGTTFDFGGATPKYGIPAPDRGS